jgi:hypothetical protein
MHINEPLHNFVQGKIRQYLTADLKLASSPVFETYKTQIYEFNELPMSQRYAIHLECNGLDGITPDRLSVIAHLRDSVEYEEQYQFDVTDDHEMGLLEEVVSKLAWQEFEHRELDILGEYQEECFANGMTFY